jgi:Na+:H+ antiporter, NhaA family
LKIKFTSLFVEFFESEQASGIVLILCTITSIMIANSYFGKEYVDFWHIQIGFESNAMDLKYSIEQWINDGLMAVFFLLIGLEMKREFFVGELSDLKNSTLPIFAAIGGMLAPATIYFLLNRGTETQAGLGIPMATDAAFALGVLALLGSLVPNSLKIFLVALAIIDDLGAIVVIAVFYASDLSPTYLMLALGVFAVLFILNRFGIKWLPLYLIFGIIMWYFMLSSGVHPTIAGVLLAFVLPFSNHDETSPSYQLQHFLNRPTTFMILPLFALANTGITMTGNWADGLFTANGLGIFVGLLIGKPIGILGFSFLAIKFGLSQLPNAVSWKQLIGIGFLGGIGFTISIFIALLAFDNPEVIQISKITVLVSSFLAGTLGFLILNTEKRREFVGTT